MRAPRSVVPFVAVIALFALNACRSSDRNAELTSALATALEGEPSTPVEAVWSDVRAFYARRNQPVWITDRSGGASAVAALNVMRRAPDDGLRAEDYGEAGLSHDLAALKDVDHDAAGWAQRVAAFDVRLTTALLTFGRDVALGRSTPTSLDLNWKARREPPDFAGALIEAADRNLAGWLDSLRPHHPEYAALQQALKDLRAQAEQGGWPAVSRRTFAAGESDPTVAALRQRLAVSGELRADATGSTAYDKDVDAGVRAFQEHHAIKATGIADAATLAEMNVPLDERIHQVELNLERWRWLPDDFGARHFLVNIPSYLLMAREDGKTVLDIRVVVGKPPDHQTPVFSGNMATVVFSPYWNVPESIVEGETAPAAARDPNYLTRNEIEILRVSRSGATVVDPANINWDRPGEFKNLAFRQRPGAKNALGHVKFLFPNEFNVYIHDTPADALFARRVRALSHGCVRVEEPEALAAYVLRDDRDWDQPRILEAMDAGTEQSVRMKETIPVHLVYFTAWVDEGGGLHFFPDVYGYDRKQEKAAVNLN